MNSTKVSKDERERLLDWAKENYSEEKSIFTKKDSSCESYFSPFNQENNFIEYDFSTLPELKEKLLEIWDNDEEMKKVALICSVATFKSKPADKVVESDSKIIKNESDKNFYVPDFVYAF